MGALDELMMKAEQTAAAVLSLVTAARAASDVSEARRLLSEAAYETINLDGRIDHALRVSRPERPEH